MSPQQIILSLFLLVTLSTTCAALPVNQTSLYIQHYVFDHPRCSLDNLSQVTLLPAASSSEKIKCINAGRYYQKSYCEGDIGVVESHCDDTCQKCEQVTKHLAQPCTFSGNGKSHFQFCGKLAVVNFPKLLWVLEYEQSDVDCELVDKMFKISGFTVDKCEEDLSNHGWYRTCNQTHYNIKEYSGESCGKLKRSYTGRNGFCEDKTEYECK